MEKRTALYKTSSDKVLHGIEYEPSPLQLLGEDIAREIGEKERKKKEVLAQRVCSVLLNVDQHSASEGLPYQEIPADERVLELFGRNFKLEDPFFPGLLDPFAIVLMNKGFRPSERQRLVYMRKPVIANLNPTIQEKIRRMHERRDYTTDLEEVLGAIAGAESFEESLEVGFVSITRMLELKSERNGELYLVHRNDLGEDGLLYATGLKSGMLGDVERTRPLYQGPYTEETDTFEDVKDEKTGELLKVGAKNMVEGFLGMNVQIL